MKFNYPAFNAWFISKRNSLDLTQRQLSAAIGVHNTALSYMETKASDITVGNFCAICSALGEEPSSVLKDFYK